MMYAIITAILIILICILFLPLKVEVSYKEKKLKIVVFITGIPVCKISPDIKSKKKENPSKEDSSKRVEELEKDVLTFGEKIKHYAEIYTNTVKLLRKYVAIDKVDLKIDVGTGNAATTAIGTGILWSAAYRLISIIGSIMYINRHHVEINPIYTNTAFSLDGKCIIKSRIAYIIFIVITILMKIKSRKGKEE